MRPRRLRLEVEIKWHSKCNRLYLRVRPSICIDEPTPQSTPTSQHRKQYRRVNNSTIQINRSAPQSTPTSQHLKQYRRVDNLTIHMNESTLQYIYLRVSTTLSIDELTLHEQCTWTSQHLNTHSPSHWEYHSIPFSNHNLIGSLSTKET